MNMRRIIISVLLSVFVLSQANAVPSFPGAQGSGAVSVGGRGGAIIMVTNLSDSGTGSLRACVQASGPRTCVFRVGGTINLLSTLRVNNPFLTIAGQTAPGGGILLKGTQFGGIGANMFVVNAANVLVRYIRVRKGFFSGCSGECGGNIILGQGGSNFMGDHLSASWNQDEGIGINTCCPNITFSYSIVAEGFANHSTGFFYGGNSTAAAAAAMTNQDNHHNLSIDNNHRNPLLRNKSSRFVNNIYYNNCYYINNVSGGVLFDAIGNKFRKGPCNGSINPNVKEIGLFAGYSGLSASGTPSVYLSGNIGWNQTSPTGNQWLLAEQINNEGGTRIGDAPAGWQRGSPQSAITYPIIAEPVTSIEASMLPHVGASRRLDCNGNWVTNRDSVDARYINHYNTGTGNAGVISNENQVGGFPVIASGTPCPDADLDGMPDSWESSNGLNPNNAADRNAVQSSGFTNLEDYLAGPSAITTDPAVSITSPTPGAIVSGSTPISAIASDNVAVLGVQFKLNGSNFGAEDTTFPYSVSWNTSASGDGVYTITAVARDADTSTTSNPVTVTVNNTTADTTSPTVSFTAPAAAATVSGASVTVSANASDNTGVAGVQFRLDGVNGTAIGLEDTSSPYSVTWDTTLVPNGSHTLYAIARDSSGNTSSTVRTVTTSNAAVTSFTIGETNLLSFNDSGNGNLLLAQENTLPQQATLQSMSFYITTASGSLRMGVYDDTGPGGGPGAKRGETASIVPVVGWNTVPIITPVLLPTGDYWLAYLPSSSGLGFKAESTGGNTRQYPFTFGQLPATFSTTPQTSTWRWSLYATFSVPTGDTTPPTVSLTAPANGATVSGLVTVSAAASDNARGGWSTVQD